MSVEPSPAATVVLVRDVADRDGVEVFMVRRSDRTRFMANAWVFPGGRVDPVDYSRDADGWCDGAEMVRLPGTDRADAVAHAIAAVREVFEEAGVLLARDPSGVVVSLRDRDVHARFAIARAEVHGGRIGLREIAITGGLRVALDLLVPLAHWVTPEAEPRRYDTWFFAAAVPAHQDPVHDASEMVDSVWATPEDALRRFDNGEIVLPPPTWVTLQDLARCRSARDALTWAGAQHLERRQPVWRRDQDGDMLVLPGDPLYPDNSPATTPFATRFVLTDGVWRPAIATPRDPDLSKTQGPLSKEDRRK